MAKSKKKFLRFNFFIFLLIVFILFTIGSFIIVIVNENKNSSEAPRNISCSDLDLVEKEVSDLFIRDIFLRKELSSEGFSQGKIIILKNQTEEKVKDTIASNLEIPLLGYGIYKVDDVDDYTYKFKKGKYLFSISLENPNELINAEEIFNMPDEAIILVLKCEVKE